MADITVFIASYNTRRATQLAVLSAHRFAGMQFVLIVGDSAVVRWVERNAPTS